MCGFHHRPFAGSIIVVVGSSLVAHDIDSSTLVRRHARPL